MTQKTIEHFPASRQDCGDQHVVAIKRELLDNIGKIQFMVELADLFSDKYCEVLSNLLLTKPEKQQH